MNLVMELTKLDKRILGLKTQIADLEKQGEAARIRAKELREQIAGLRSQRQKGLADGQPDTFSGKLKKLGEEIDLQEDLAFGLAAKEKEIGAQMPPLQAHRREIFVKEISAWLVKEVADHDQAARALIEKLKRLFAARAILEEVGARQTYVTIIGPGYDLLPGIRPPVLAGFDRSKYHLEKYHAEFKIIDLVRAEIMKGS
jgi:chromosome segregation ATPase